MNTDQGSKLTSIDFIEVLKGSEISISMDGKCAWRDNVFVERLRRTINTKKSICAPTHRSPRPAHPSGSISAFTTAAARIHRLAGGTRSDLSQCADANPGGGIKRAEIHLRKHRILFKQPSHLSTPSLQRPKNYAPSLS